MEQLKIWDEVQGRQTKEGDDQDGGGDNEAEQLTNTEEMIAEVIGKECIGGIEGGMDTLEDTEVAASTSQEGLHVPPASTPVQMQDQPETVGLQVEHEEIPRSMPTVIEEVKKKVKPMDEFERAYLKLKRKEVKYLKKMYKWQKVNDVWHAYFH